MQGSDGNFYGTTEGGGTYGGDGTVFKISTNGALTTLYSFTGTNDGGYPGPGWCRAATAISMARLASGGTGGNGTVFKISTNGTLTTLYSFHCRQWWRWSQAGLVQGSDGSFYGTTYRRRPRRRRDRVPADHCA